MKRLSLFCLLAITIFSFALTMVSNTLEPSVLGHKVLELVPGQRNTALGLTTFAGLIVAGGASVREKSPALSGHYDPLDCGLLDSWTEFSGPCIKSFWLMGNGYGKRTKLGFDAIGPKC